MVDLAAAMDLVLPQERILADVQRLLADAERVELDGEWIAIAPDCELMIVARSCHERRVEVGFGTHFRALVAVGVIREVQHGIVEPGLCFASLWYSDKGELITVDFTSSMP